MCETRLPDLLVHVTVGPFAVAGGDRRSAQRGAVGRSRRVLRMAGLAAAYSCRVSMPVVAQKLTLVSEVPRSGGGAPWVLDKPVWIRPGERYWLDEERRALVIENLAGTTQSHPCWFASGPDAPR